MKMKKSRFAARSLLLAMLFAASGAHAYRAGNQIDESLAHKLQISNGVAVVDFFASWCVSCKKELPLLQAMGPELAKAGVKLVGVDTDEAVKDGLVFQKALGLTFPVFNDENQEVVAKFAPLGMPAIYFIKDRKVVKVLFGAIDHIDKVIAGELKGLK